MSAVSLEEARMWARSWLFNHALPLWWNAGHDGEYGGFYDKLDESATPVDLPKRIRVQARQAYVYAEAGRLGWQGPWREATEAATSFMLSAYRRPDGLFRSSVSRDGTSIVEDADLYDQAFVLFALAAAHRMAPEASDWHGEARALLQILIERFAHPIGGFRETDGKAGQRSNPHMHMLEALLAWVELLGEDDFFAPVARRIISVALDHMIDPVTGSIGEYYDDEWCLRLDESGQIREPGHQFEWVYLLRCSEKLLGIETVSIRDRMYRFAAAHGIMDGRAIFSVDLEGQPIDRGSRLWAQTEWLRTSLLRATDATEPDKGCYLSDAMMSFACTQRFLDTRTKGLWRDRMNSRGEWVDEPSPASSLYHIMTGFVPLIGE